MSNVEHRNFPQAPEQGVEFLLSRTTISTVPRREECGNLYGYEKRPLTFVQRRNFLLAILVAGLVLIAIVANATTLVHLQLQELVRYSNAIARVHCIGSAVTMEKGEIWSDTRFQVIASEKGNLPATIVVRLPGGTFQHLHSRVDGSPQFQQEEELYLFLLGRPDGKFNVVGWSQGAFRIHRDARSGVETVTQDSADVPVYNMESHAFEKMGVKNMRAETFVERVRQEASRINSLQKNLN